MSRPDVGRAASWPLGVKLVAANLSDLLAAFARVMVENA